MGAMMEEGKERKVGLFLYADDVFGILSRLRAEVKGHEEEGNPMVAAHVEGLWHEIVSQLEDQGVTPGDYREFQGRTVDTDEMERYLKEKGEDTAAKISDLLAQMAEEYEKGHLN
jgi:hypothetical protein